MRKRVDLERLRSWLDPNVGVFCPCRLIAGRVGRLVTSFLISLDILLAVYQVG